MELIFIRHGQPEWVRDGLNLMDPSLTALGRDQARRLGESTSTWKPPLEVLVSPTARARETAEPVCRALGVEAVIQAWFEEIRLPPSWEGAPAEQVTEFFLKARRRSVDEWWRGMPGGESFHDFYDRITTNLTKVLADRGAYRAAPEAHPSVWNIEDRDQRIVFVGHGGSNSAAISFLLGIEPVPWSWERFVSYHASVSRLKASSLLGGRIFGLRSLSDVSHLPPELQTR